MHNITKRGAGAVPALPEDFATQLSSGIAESRATTVIAGGGKLLLRMGKDGIWIYGPSNEEVLEGSLWVVNIATLAHGFCCWKDAGRGANVLAGEVMVSMTQPKPRRPDPIDGTPYTEQRSFELKCLDGDDAGLEVLYKTASIGGMRAVDALLADIQAALDAYRQNPSGPAYVFPVLDLSSESYNHPKWGKTYNPIMEVVAWADTEGNLETSGNVAGEEPLGDPELPEIAEPEPEPEPPPAAPARRRRNAAAAAPAPEAAPPARTAAAATKAAPRAPEPTPEPRSTTQVHTGQRRRPTSR